MLEIIVIWRLVVAIGNIAARKGLKKLAYQIMAVVFWLCGELAGATLAQILLVNENSFWLNYGLALGGAVIGAALAFLVMKLLPEQGPAVQTVPLAIQEPPPSGKKLARSVWVPVTASVLIIICLCVGFGASVLFKARQLVQEFHVTDPLFGTGLGNDGRIAQPSQTIPWTARAIYFSFDFDTPSKTPTELNFEWYFNGQLTDSFNETVKPGNNVVVWDCEKLHIAHFSPGQYEVRVRMGDFPLLSAQFTIQ